MKLRKRKLCSQSSESAPSHSGVLKGQESLIAEILSYLIHDTKDLANLRLISKSWNRTVIPFCLRSKQFIRICRPPIHRFLEEVVKYGDINYTGQVYEGGDGAFTSFDFIAEAYGRDGRWPPWPKVTKLVFFRDMPRDDEEIFLSVAKQKPYSFVKDSAEEFANYCSILSHPSSLDEFESTAKQAFERGMFLSVEDLKRCKRKGAVIKVKKQGQHYNMDHVPMVATIKLERRDFYSLKRLSSKVILFDTKVPKYLLANLYPFAMDTASDRDYRNEYLYPSFAGYNPEQNSDGTISCHVPMALRQCWDLTGMLSDLGSWKSHVGIEIPLRKCREQPVREGVAIADGFIRNDLQRNLMKEIDSIAKNQTADYLPGTGSMIRCIVHPSLYSYVKGVSQAQSFKAEDHKLFEDSPMQEEEKEDQAATKSMDYWGRPYQVTMKSNNHWDRPREVSPKYQWLPTYFSVGPDGSCTICDYINNLVPRSRHEGLYGLLAQLFSQALPLIESVYGYCQVVRETHIRKETEAELVRSENPIRPIEEKPATLRGKEVQVVTTIVDFMLGAGETYEDVWHVEGMPHEEIVATALYVIDRDDEEIEGGNLLFKRAFHKQEAEFICSNVKKIYQTNVQGVADKGLMPLGQTELVKGRLVVFPNSHVQKMTELKNTLTRNKRGRQKKRKRKQRIVTFHLINPEQRVLSTREVGVQQEHAGGSMKLDDALEHRELLMEERKNTKQDWNVRRLHIEKRLYNALGMQLAQQPAFNQLTIQRKKDNNTNQTISEADLPSHKAMDIFSDGLVHAATKGDLSRVQELLAKGAHAMAQDDFGYTALHGACGCSHLGILELLIAYGANDMNARTKTGYTPLHPACWRGDLKIVKLLVKHGADPNAKQNNGGTPLHRVCEKGHLEVIEFLIESGAKVNPIQLDGGTPLHLACREGHLEVSKVLIKNDADVNARDIEKGETPMHKACEKGHLDIAKLLTENGAVLNAKAIDGSTPLYIACKGGHLEIVRLFFVQGTANVNVKTSKGLTPLHEVCVFGYLEIVKLLITNGADLNAKDEHGETPIHNACTNRLLEIAKLLKEKGADINIKSNNFGLTALHRACRNRIVEIVKFLVESGAALNVKNDDGDTPLHLACEYPPHLKITKLLVENGASINAKNWTGKTALHGLCRLGGLDTIKFLVDHRADIDAKDDDGMTPFHWACFNGDLDIIKFLLENGADLNAQDLHEGVGKTPIYLACEFGRLEVVKLLLSRGADLLLETTEGNTPLLAASENMYLEIVWFLVQQYPWLVSSS